MKKNINNTDLVMAQAAANLISSKVAVLNHVAIWSGIQIAAKLSDVNEAMQELNKHVDSINNSFYGENAPMSDVLAAKQSQFNKEME